MTLPSLTSALGTASATGAGASHDSPQPARPLGKSKDARATAQASDAAPRSSPGQARKAKSATDSASEALSASAAPPDFAAALAQRLATPPGQPSQDGAHRPTTAASTAPATAHTTAAALPEAAGQVQLEALGLRTPGQLPATGPALDTAAAHAGAEGESSLLTGHPAHAEHAMQVRELSQLAEPSDFGRQLPGAPLSARSAPGLADRTTDTLALRGMAQASRRPSGAALQTVDARAALIAAERAPRSQGQETPAEAVLSVSSESTAAPAQAADPAMGQAGLAKAETGAGLAISTQGQGPTATASGSASAAPATHTAHLPQEPGSAAWQQALGQQLIFMSQSSLASAQLQLNPLELGPLKISLNLTGESLSAQFSAEQSAVREAVESALPQLRAALAEQGLNLGQTSVDAGSRESTPFENPEGHHGQERQAQQQGGQDVLRPNPQRAAQAPASSPTLMPWAGMAGSRLYTRA